MKNERIEELTEEQLADVAGGAFIGGQMSNRDMQKWGRYLHKTFLRDYMVGVPTPTI